MLSIRVVTAYLADRCGPSMFTQRRKVVDALPESHGVCRPDTASSNRIWCENCSSSTEAAEVY